MSDKSGIGWTDATWNPTTGCTKVSPGCKNCYAKHQAWPRLAAMETGVYSGRVFEDVQVHPERLDQPLRWTRPRMIFVNSMSDLFHEDIPDKFIQKVFTVMALADKHIFQVLTKRPLRMLDFMRRFEYLGSHQITEMKFVDPKTLKLRGRPWPLPNVWLGTSVENQETADERIPLLLETPAAVRWLSCEPLLDAVSLEMIENNGDLHDRATRGSYWRPLDGNFKDSATIDWVVVGGESGPKARPMKEGWAQNIMLECRDANVPFFMKQGSQTPEWPHYHDIESFPFNLRVREYPQ